MKPQRATRYPERAVRAAVNVLVELGLLLEDVQDRIVLIGGFVPWLTLEGPPAHVGTLDIDLNIDLEAFSDLEASSLLKRLEKAGYERNTVPLMPFRLRRWVLEQSSSGVNLEPLEVMVDLLTPQTPGKVNVNPSGVLPVQGAPGAHLALRWHRSITLQGHTPEGMAHQVKWRVASLPALLAMKGYSISENRAKDAYDIYYVMQRYPGGSRALAQACLPLLEDEVAVQAYRRIAAHFRAEDDLGPQLVASFLLESSALGELNEEQVMQDSFQRTQAWFQALGLV